MRKGYLAIAVAAIVVAAIATIAVVTIEPGLAFQSQTDNTGTIKLGNYVEATASDGGMVSITPVVYAETDDKESFVLSNTTQSVRGTLEVGTINDQTKDLTAIVNFQERGTWLFIETMNLSTQRELCFTMLVSTSVTLGDTTVITINNTGASITNAATVSGSWKAWGVGETVTNYVVSEHPGDVYKGFIVLIKSDLALAHHYNVLTIFNTLGNSVAVENRTPHSIGESVTDTGSWRVWNTGSVVSSYSLNENDLFRCTDTAVARTMYDSSTTTGIAGTRTEAIPVITGAYQFSIDIKYKSQINIDPTDFQGENMKSNIVFILS
jgi:hypothetical protein